MSLHILLSFNRSFVHNHTYVKPYLRTPIHHCVDHYKSMYPRARLNVRASVSIAVSERRGSNKVSPAGAAARKTSLAPAPLINSFLLLDTHELQVRRVNRLFLQALTAAGEPRECRAARRRFRRQRRIFAGPWSQQGSIGGPRAQRGSQSSSKACYGPQVLPGITNTSSDQGIFKGTWFMHTSRHLETKGNDLRPGNPPKSFLRPRPLAGSATIEDVPQTSGTSRDKRKHPVDYRKSP